MWAVERETLEEFEYQVFRGNIGVSFFKEEEKANRYFEEMKDHSEEIKISEFNSSLSSEEKKQALTKLLSSRIEVPTFECTMLSLESKFLSIDYKIIEDMGPQDTDYWGVFIGDHRIDSMSNSEYDYDQDSKYQFQPYDLYLTDTLGLIKDIENMSSISSKKLMPISSLIDEAQAMIEEKIKNTTEAYNSALKEASVNAVIEWANKNDFDHMIACQVQKNDGDITYHYYPARPDDMLPNEVASDKKWEHLDFDELKKNVLHQFLPKYREPYEQMYAREIAEVEAVKFMGIDNYSIPVELSSRIFHRFESDEQGIPRFVDSKEEPSFVMATVEIDGELFAVFVSETGIGETDSTLLTENDHEDYQEINLKLQNIAQERLIEVLNGCVPAKAKEYGESRSLDKEYIDTLAKNTIVRRSLDNQDQIYIEVRLPVIEKRQESPNLEQVEKSHGDSKKTFSVQISETMKQSYQIEASSEEEAIKIAQEGYESETMGPTIETNCPFANFEIIHEDIPEKEPAIAKKQTQEREEPLRAQSQSRGGR